MSQSFLTPIIGKPMMSFYFTIKMKTIKGTETILFLQSKNVDFLVMAKTDKHKKQKLKGK